MKQLETQRLRIRQLTDADAPFILELLTDPDWLRFIGDRGVRTLEDARRYIAQGPHAMYALRGHSLCLVELREGDVPIGMCGLLRRDILADVDLGFAFLPKWRGGGYAREAAEATLEDARLRLGIRQVLAITSPDNVASQRLLERLGFVEDSRPTLPGESSPVVLYGLMLAE